jgi:peroxiredoxin
MKTQRTRSVRAVVHKGFALSAVAVLLLVSACTANRASAPETPVMSIIEFTYVPADERLPTFPNGGFDPSRAIFPVVKTTPVTGIPDTLQAVQVLHAFVDSNQYFYQSFRAGHIPEDLYNRISAHIDSTVLSADWVDGITISVLVAQNAAGERIVIVDRDNDGDFAGEPALEFRPDTIVAGERRFPIEAATSPVSFEYYENGEVKRRTAPARFVYMEGADPADLAWQIAEYPIGTWTVRGESFSVALAAEAVYRPGRYNFFYVDVAGDGRFDPDEEGLEAYSIAEPFNIAGLGWRISRLAADGSHVELERVAATVMPRTALREGNPTPDFVAVTIGGDRLSLADLAGRYVLLNFAATWCPWSRDELPFLRAAHAEHAGERFTIVTLLDAERPAAVQRFIQEEILAWPHVAQSREDEIARTYRVLGFPTNYLVDPQGVIVAGGQALRGDSLAATLRQHLGGRR